VEKIFHKVPNYFTKKVGKSFPTPDRFQIATCLTRKKVLTRVQEVQDHAMGSSASPYPEDDKGMILRDFFPIEFNLLGAHQVLPSLNF